MKSVDQLNWNDLKFLILVKRHGTLAKAAEKMGVNHSTVFRRIKNLEEDLGVKLFKRLVDRYVLSEIGEDIVNHVGEIEDCVSDIQRLLDNKNENMSGPINVTLPHNFGYRFLPTYIAEFQELYPEVSVNLLITNADSNLTKGEADLAIRACASPPEHLVGKRLFSLSWAAYSSTEYLERCGKPNDQTELHQHKLISAHVNLTFLPAFQWIDKHIPSTQIVARSNDLVSMSSLAEAGIGIAILPDDQAKPTLQRLFTVDFASSSDIWILIHPDMRGCKRLKVFKDFITERLQKETIFAAN